MGYFDWDGHNVVIHSLSTGPALSSHIERLLCHWTEQGALFPLGLHLVAETCDAKAEGIDKGSWTVSFEPGPIKVNSYTADPGTAGSTTLILQISLPCLRFAKRSDWGGG